MYTNLRRHSHTFNSKSLDSEYHIMSFDSERVEYIKYLILNKYPTIRIDLYGKPHFNSTATDEFIELYKTYFTELSKKNTIELKVLVQAEKDKQKQTTIEAEVIAEKNRFFNQHNAEADYIYWMKMAYWTLDEAVALLLGKDPRSVSYNNIITYKSTKSAFVRKYLEYYELFKRRFEKHENLEPQIFIFFAREIKINVPIELIFSDDDELKKTYNKENVNKQLQKEANIVVEELCRAKFNKQKITKKLIAEKLLTKLYDDPNKRYLVIGPKNKKHLPVTLERALKKTW